MKKNLLTAGIFFGLNRLLCDSSKKTGLFDGANNFINANGILCGAIEKFTEENGHLYLENVYLDKNKIAEIFSGGFITKASQRIGMDFSINLNGEIKTFENVWVDDMTSPREGKDSIKIEKMICSVEVRGVGPESSSGYIRLPFEADISYPLIIKVGDEEVGRLDCNGITLSSSQLLSISSNEISIGNRMVSSNNIKI